MYQYQIANNLCRLCDEQNISIDELAERIGKSSRQVSRYRNGGCQNITLATLERIANVLDVQIFELLK
jgi:transcriptional regulator with XRE-family HTH domain